MSQPAPHDTLFHHLLSHDDTAVAALSSWVTGTLDVNWETLRWEPTVTREVFGGERRTDFVFSVRSRGGATLLLYVHVEHQRTVEVHMALRTVEYQTRIVTAWLRAHGDTELLPVVVSVVVYNGDDPWSAATAYEALVDPGMSAAAGPYQLRASYVLVDLPAIREGLLAAAARHPHLVLGLLLLRAASRRAGQPGWQVLVRRARLIGRIARLPGGQERVDALFAYAGRVFGAPAREVYDEIQARATPVGRKVMQSWQDVLRKEGLEKGLEQGLEQGLERGRDEGVLIGEILTWARVRFGPLPEDVVARVKAASADDLRRWRGVVESAEDLDALFHA